jgi:hypothetical protein
MSDIHSQYRYESFSYVFHVITYSILPTVIYETKLCFILKEHFYVY